MGSSASSLEKCSSPKVGFWMSEKKIKALASCHSGMENLTVAFRERGLELVKVDLKQPLEQQGPFVAFFHKLSEVLFDSDDGKEKAQEVISKLDQYFTAHPNLRIFDSFPSLRPLRERFSCYDVMHRVFDDMNGQVFVPDFVLLESADDFEGNCEKIRRRGLVYPLVCKQVFARDHDMSLVYNPEGLKNIIFPSVAMTFVNHGAKVYKIFCIGNRFWVIVRPSIRNQEAGPKPTFHFHTHKIYRDVHHPLLPPVSFMDANFSVSIGEEGTPEYQTLLEEGYHSSLASITRRLVEAFAVTLFGYDVVEEEGTSRLALIDINIFPGYAGVPGVSGAFCDDFVMPLLQKKQGKGEEDSGIDSADERRDLIERGAV